MSTIPSLSFGIHQSGHQPVSVLKHRLHKMYMHAQQEEYESGMLHPDSYITDHDTYCGTDYHGSGWRAAVDGAVCPDSWEDDFDPTAVGTAAVANVSDSTQAAPAFISGGCKGLLSQALDGMLSSEYSDLPVAFGLCFPSLPFVLCLVVLRFLHAYTASVTR
jgi:hypothetical protein